MNAYLKKFISCLILLTFFTQTVFAQNPASGGAGLPAPGTMVNLTPAFNPILLKGVKIDPENPLRFDFIVDTGDENFVTNELKNESTKLIKYFLAALTVPENDLWVNLSPSDWVKCPRFFNKIPVVISQFTVGQK